MLAEDDQVGAGLHGGDAGNQGTLAAQPQRGPGKQDENEDGKIEASKEMDHVGTWMEMEKVGKFNPEGFELLYINVSSG